MQEGAVLRDSYRLERLLGRGGMADVYLAFDLRRQVNIAVKVLREDLAEDPEFVRRFQREAEALARLDHPYIVRFYSFERQGNTAFIVMDYVSGTTLRGRMMESSAPLPLAETTGILRQIGTALQYAHNEGFIHRDIKPGNIMLREDGTALLSDFGIARATEASTMTLGPLGTPAYMSPEQILGRETDARTDIYSMGVVTYEMATGRRPFVGETGTGTGTTERMRYEHLHAPPPDPRQFNPGLPPAAAQVIMRALAKDPGQRWPDVIGMVRAWETGLGLEHLAAQPSRETGGPRTPLTPPRQAQTPPRASVGSPAGQFTQPATAIAPPQYAPPSQAPRRGGFMLWGIIGAVVLLMGGGLVCGLILLKPSPAKPTREATSLAVADTATAAPEATLTSEPRPTSTRRATATLDSGGGERAADDILSVVSHTAWQDGNGNISIVGEVKNVSQEAIGNVVRIEATLLDASGATIQGDFRAFIDRPSIAPGDKSGFWMYIIANDLGVDASTVAEYKLKLWITEDPSPDVELVVDNSEAVSENGKLFIRGKVSNQTDTEYAVLSVYSTIYDSSGNVANVTLDTIELDKPLGPGESIDFEGYFIDHFEDAESFFVIVTGWTKEAWGGGGG